MVSGRANVAETCPVSICRNSLYDSTSPIWGNAAAYSSNTHQSVGFVCDCRAGLQPGASRCEQLSASAELLP